MRPTLRRSFPPPPLRRSLGSLRADAEGAPRRRRDRGFSTDVFEADPAFAAWAATAAERGRNAVAREAVAGGLAARDEAAEGEALKAAGAAAAALEARLAAVEGERDVLAETLSAQAAEIGRVTEAADRAADEKAALAAKLDVFLVAGAPSDDAALGLRVADLEAANATLAREGEKTRRRADLVEGLERRLEEAEAADGLLAAERAARAADVARLEAELMAAPASLEAEAARLASEADGLADARAIFEQMGDGGELASLRSSQVKLSRRASEFSWTMK